MRLKCTICVGGSTKILTDKIGTNSPLVLDLMCNMIVRFPNRLHGWCCCCYYWCCGGQRYTPNQLEITLNGMNVFRMCFSLRYAIKRNVGMLIFAHSVKLWMRRWWGARKRRVTANKRIAVAVSTCISGWAIDASSTSRWMSEGLLWI